MKHTLTFIFTILIAFVSFGQTVKIQDNETVDAFIKRLTPDSTELTHQIIETNAWDTAGNSIIAFYGYDDPNDVNIGFNEIFGHLYFPIGKNIYRDISFGPMGEDGGYPEIISVFFANADKDKIKELIVLCKLPQQHLDYAGDFYETYIFDNPSEQNQLTYLGELSDKFWGCECSWSNGKTAVAKYKTAKDIKAGLKKMGF